MTAPAVCQLIDAARWMGAQLRIQIHLIRLNILDRG